MALPGVTHVTNATSSNQLFSCLIILSVEDFEQNSEQEGYK